MNRTTLERTGNIIALFAVVTVNYLANALPIAGQTTAAVSARYESLFTPAGYTFAIWGLIYLGLAVFAIYQALPAQRHSAALGSISKWFLLNCLANCLWILAWHNEWLAVSLLLMLVILATLVRIYRALDIALGGATAGRRLAARLPFSIYTAWITVATIANVSALQTALGWNELWISEVHWTLLKLALAGAIAAGVTLLRRDLAFGLVVAWAATGIMSKQAPTPSVAGAAGMLSAMLLIVVTFQAWRNWRGVEKSADAFTD